MKNKIIIGLMSFIMTLTIVATSIGENASGIFDSASISASAETSGDYEYELLDDGTVEITGYNGEDENVTIPSAIAGKKVTSIGDGAFYECTSLTSVTIPNSVTSIGDNAFLDCDFLEIINTDSNNGHYSSKDGVLFNKDKTKLIKYPGANTRRSYTIPNGVITISDYAFEDCDNLTSIIIPNSVIDINNDAFSSCDFLSINVDSDNKIYSSQNGILFNKNKTELIKCLSRASEISIPNSVEKIGNSAFESCYNLTDLFIYDNVKTIGNRAFSSCYNLTSVTIGNGVTNIGYSAFEYCSNLTDVSFGNSVTSIGSYVFFACESLTNITIPKSVAYIGESAFGWCENLKDIYYTGTEEDFNRIQISSNEDDLTGTNKADVR